MLLKIMCMVLLQLRNVSATILAESITNTLIWYQTVTSRLKMDIYVS